MNTYAGGPYEGRQGWIVILSGLLAICALATLPEPAFAQEGWPQKRKYVIITDLSSKDPYYKAVRRLQEHRGAQVVPFKTDRLSDALGTVRQLDPQFVAVVVKPDTLDVNFAYDVLEFNTMLDDDPFPDFAYGFITGATADDAVRFVDNIIRAEREKDGVKHKIFAFGPSDISQVDDGNSFTWARSCQRVRLAHASERFPKGRLGDLASSGIIRIWGHGSPEEIEDGLSFHRHLSDIGHHSRASEGRGAQTQEREK